MDSSTTFVEKLKAASRAVVGVFSDDEKTNTDTHGLLNALFPTERGDAPQRGTKNLLNAYSEMPWLRACSSKIATSIASTHWGLYVHKKEGRAVRTRAMQVGSPQSRLQARRKMDDVVEIDDHILLDALNYGNSLQTGRSMMKTVQVHLDLIGDAFLLKQRNGLSAPVAFWPIPPDWVQATPTPKTKKYEIGFRGWQGQIPETEILWLSDPNPANPYGRGSGLGNVLADELETNEYAGRHLRQFFFNRARPDLIISPKQKSGTDSPLRPEEVERLEHDWLSKNQGFWRAFKPYFVSREIEVKELATDFRSMQFSELRSAQRDIIIQTFGLPPEILGVIENSNRATIEAADYLFAKYVLTPRLEFLRSVFQERLIPEYDDRLIVDYDSPVQEDKRHELDAAKANTSVLTIDEWRELAGYDPLSDDRGDVHLMPANLLEVSLGRTPPPPQEVIDPGKPPEPETPATTPEPVAEKEQHAPTRPLVMKAEDDSNEEGLPPLIRIADRREGTMRRRLLSEWTDVRDAIDEPKLLDAVRSNRVMTFIQPASDAWLDTMRGLHDELASMCMRGSTFAAEASSIPLAKSVKAEGDHVAEISFSQINQASVDYASSRTDFLVDAMGIENKQAIQDTIATSIKEGWGSEKTARKIRGSIGLTEQHTTAISHEEERRLKKAAKRRGVTIDELNEQYPNDVVKIEGQMARFTAKRYHMRAKLIARTELATAANRGQNIVWEKAIESNVLRRDEVRRQWVTAGFDVDAICQDLEGTFTSFDGGATFDGGYVEPPAHPNCRCTLILVEVPRKKAVKKKTATSKRTAKPKAKGKSTRGRASAKR